MKTLFHGNDLEAQLPEENRQTRNIRLILNGGLTGSGREEESMSEKETVIGGNISALAKKLCALLDRLPCQIEEACRAIVEESEEADDPAESSELLSYSYSTVKAAVLSEVGFSSPPMQSEATSGFLLSAAESALPAVSAFAAETLAGLTDKCDLPAAAHIHSPTIAYFRNSYSDSAYRIFSRTLGQARAVYFDDMQTVCDEVYNDRCDFCILPLGDPSGERLSGIGRLVSGYGLFMVLTCTVETAGGDSEMEFGLFRSGGCAQDDADTLELIAFTDESRRLSHLMLSLELIGYSLSDCCRVASPSESESAFRLVFNLKDCPDEKRKAVIRAALIFIRCEFPHSIVTGLYRRLSPSH